MNPVEIWSGGQTGVDRAALDAALELGLSIGGWIPRWRLAEDGAVSPRYSGLRELESSEYADRTRKNVEDTDATLILRMGEAVGGTLLTLEAARRLGRPVLDLDLAGSDPVSAAARVRQWLATLTAGSAIRLNVAGPRASQAPSVYASAREVLRLALVSSPLDRWLRPWRIRTRHEVEVTATPKRALAALLATPVTPDGVVALLFRLRGLRWRGPIAEALPAGGFVLLESSAEACVMGLAARGLRLERVAGPPEWSRATAHGLLRAAVAFWAEPSGAGARLMTETRVDGRGRWTWLVFRLYWLAVAPFSSLVRRHWLRAAAARLPPSSETVRP